MSDAKKSLGQHWLTNQASLAAIIRAANLEAYDTVVEIGPGKGALTKELVAVAAQVEAVELDGDLADTLGVRVQAKNLNIHRANALDFEYSELPPDYKVVANIPYYITAQLLRMFTEIANKPKTATLLVQKEVAERVVAQPGSMSLLALSVQMHFDVALAEVIPREHFTPRPQVDSQILCLSRLEVPRITVEDHDFFRLAKAGFGERRKKLRSALAGGLQVSKQDIDAILIDADIHPAARAQELSFAEWQRLYTVYKKQA